MLLASTLIAVHSIFPARASRPYSRLALKTTGEMSARPRRIAYLGTPTVAADALDLLLEGSKESNPPYEVVAVVSQPPAPQGRRKVLTPSPVHDKGAERGLPVLTPPSAKDERFLEAMAALDLDLCITMAYGCFLPQRFLDIPRFGTLNLHPSLLPRYRGAAPVQRALEAGEARTGVTLLFTVLKMDAGPIVAQIPLDLQGDEQAPEVLRTLVELGANELITTLPKVWTGEAEAEARAQDDDDATAAPKVTKEEGHVSLANETALAVHNKVRAFAEWPGTSVRLDVRREPRTVRLCLTSVAPAEATLHDGIDPQRLVFNRGALVARCGDGSLLRIHELQVSGRKRVTAKEFWNGLQDRESLRWLPK